MCMYEDSNMRHQMYLFVLEDRMKKINKGMR